MPALAIFASIHPATLTSNHISYKARKLYFSETVEVAPPTNVPLDYEREIEGLLSTPTSSFKLVADVKFLLYGTAAVTEESNSEAKFFGDPWSLNVTHFYFDTFSPGALSYKTR